MTTRYVMFMLTADKTRVKVFIKQKFYGYIEASLLMRLFNKEELNAYLHNQIKLIVDFDKFRPHIKPASAKMDEQVASPDAVKFVATKLRVIKPKSENK
jgi:hypothetical protein